ncbi:sensor histidine kinase [Vibrio alfacsensis]|uniref:sensor histidine kinase n=1 Tax=Vibrio alfacsensis TaxID=1074311 RepID=UPI004068815B
MLLATSGVHLISILLLWSQRRPNSHTLAIQIAIDLLYMTSLLYFNGGATNAFVTALLIPVVFASISLGAYYCIGFTLASISAYSLLVWNMPSDMTHHMDMASHYHGMWINFILSGVIIALVVSSMANMVAKRERCIAAHREQQLRQEQILAISIASAQVTHNIATPIATVQLLYEELQEQYPGNILIESGQASLRICAQHLDSFRQQITQIREGETSWLPINELMEKLQDAILLYFPHQRLEFSAELKGGDIWADNMLIPALVNLIHNAVNSNQENGNDRLEVRCYAKQQQCFLEFRDYGTGVTKGNIEALGYELINSNKGLGIAVLLSNMTLERLGGTLHLENHADLGCTTKITLQYRSTPHEVTDH